MDRRNYVYNRTGRLVRSSQNLRGILDHARVDSPVNVVAIKPSSPNGYDVEFYFDNGDWTVTYWSDLSVALEWLANRKSWAITRVTIDASLWRLIDGPLASLSKRSIAALRNGGTIVNSHDYNAHKKG